MLRKNMTFISAHVKKSAFTPSCAKSCAKDLFFGFLCNVNKWRPTISAIFDLPTYPTMSYYVWFLGLFSTPYLHILKSDVIYGRSLMKPDTSYQVWSSGNNVLGAIHILRQQNNLLGLENSQSSWCSVLTLPIGTVYCIYADIKAGWDRKSPKLCLRNIWMVSYCYLEVHIKTNIWVPEMYMYKSTVKNQSKTKIIFQNKNYLDHTT